MFRQRIVSGSGAWMHRLAAALEVLDFAAQRGHVRPLEVLKGQLADVMVDTSARFGHIGDVDGQRDWVATARSGDVIFDRLKHDLVIKAPIFEQGAGGPTMQGERVFGIHWAFGWGKFEELFTGQVSSQVVQDSGKFGPVRIETVGGGDVSGEFGDAQDVLEAFGFDHRLYTFAPEEDLFCLADRPTDRIGLEDCWNCFRERVQFGS